MVFVYPYLIMCWMYLYDSQSLLLINIMLSNILKML